VEDDEKDEWEDKNDIEEIKTIPQWSIALPWNDMDFVSEVYYKNIIDSKLFAKLGDVFYKNTVLKTMRIWAIFWFVLSIVLIVVSWNDFSIKTQNTLLEIWLILIYLCPLYLGLQAIPKFYLKKKISIDSYLPKIQSSEVLYNSLVSDLFSIKDIFQTIDFQPSSPLIWQSGSIILNFDLSCTYTYQSWKHSHTHEQMLLNGVIYDMPFSSFEASLNKGVTVPNWVIEALKISDDYNIWLKKRITINLILDNLPDKEYNLILKAPVTP
jgi:hypothetical protein